MSIENTKFGQLVQQIQDMGASASRETIIYYLFNEYDVSEAFDGTALIADMDWREADKAVKEFLKGVGHEVMECHGGGEGEGEYCYGVIRLGDEFYKAEWSYYSYNGCEYDWIERTVTQVTPKQKMIVVYE